MHARQRLGANVPGGKDAQVAGTAFGVVFVEQEIAVVFRLRIAGFDKGGLAEAASLEVVGLLFACLKVVFHQVVAKIPFTELFRVEGKGAHQVHGRQGVAVAVGQAGETLVNV